MASADFATNLRPPFEHELAQLGPWYSRFARFVHMNILGSEPSSVTAAATAASPTPGSAAGIAAAIAAGLLSLALAVSCAEAFAQSKRHLSTAAGATDVTASAAGIANGGANGVEGGVEGGGAADDRPAAEPAAESGADADAGATDGAASNGATGGAAANGAPAASDTAAVPPVATVVDEAFIAARKAMVASDLERYDQAILVIPRDHVLYSYVDYWRLRILLGAKRLQALTGEADAAVLAFLERNPDTIVADLLRRDWMLALGRRADWKTFDEQYAQWQLRDESAPDCYAQLSHVAQLAPGQQLGVKAKKDIHALLMRPVALNRACADLFEALSAAGLLKPREIRERFMFALEANATGDIRFTAALLGSALNEKTLERALSRPATALKSPLPRDLLLIALTRLARNDPEAAAVQLRLAQSKLLAVDRRFVWSQIAAGGMRRLAPDAHAWAREARGAKVSDATKAWMARAALRQQDWTLLRTIVLSMSEQERSEPTWIYWMGRARKAQGHPREAAKLFASLSRRHDFYGKLANEELNRPLVIPARPALPDPAAVAAFDANAGFARALAFYALGMRFEGNREWNFQLRARPDDQLRAAAHWAMQRNLLDRAINTDERIRSDADFVLRFPTPFSGQLLPITRELGLDAAWVYGLIRQESRFIMDARSHVGASGLMQLMPATARWVARKMGRRDFHQRDVNDLQTNLEFGTFYLKQALDDLDGSAVLASAGYNAGPGRARNWRGTLSGPLEGAIFAEIIPFAETRGYVKNVLSNATDYAGLFTGKPQSLKARLGTIEPKAPG
jgi:soluble lytic murein transglycosylase